MRGAERISLYIHNNICSEPSNVCIHTQRLSSTLFILISSLWATPTAASICSAMDSQGYRKARGTYSVPVALFKKTDQFPPQAPPRALTVPVLNADLTTDCIMMSIRTTPRHMSRHPSIACTATCRQSRRRAGLIHILKNLVRSTFG